MQNKKPKKKLSINEFIEFILFDRKSFSILSCISLIMAFFVCSAVFIIGIIVNLKILYITFGILTILSIKNLWKQRKRFEIFWKKDSDWVDLTVADTLNTVFNAKKDQREDQKDKGGVK